MKLILNQTIEVEKDSPSFFRNENKAVMVYEVNGKPFCDSVFNIPGKDYWSFAIQRDFTASELDDLAECTFGEYQEKVKEFSKHLPI